MLCEIKILYMEPGAHLRPAVGPTNAKYDPSVCSSVLSCVLRLSAVLPVTPKVLLNQHSLIKLRVGPETVQWIENEVWTV